jgi:hypothetical protein
MDRIDEFFGFSSLHLRLSLVVIDDLDVVTMTGTPNKTDSPLAVDPNGMLPFAIACKSLQLIARRRGQKPQFGRRMHLQELS